nr:hypothetical protein GCM10010200_068310 [Actinomadura rugatobispora]
MDAAAGFAVVSGPTPAETATAVPPMPTAVAAVMSTSLFTKPPRSPAACHAARGAGGARPWPREGREPLR